MSWTVLKPVAASAGRPMVSAQVRVSLKGKATIVLFIAGTMHEEMASPDAMDVAVGSGEDAGCLRLEGSQGGAFRLASGIGGSRRVTLPLIEGVAAKQTVSAACAVLEPPANPNGGGLVVRLPLAEWEASIVKPDHAALKASAHGLAPVRGADNKVDALAYLQTKGHTVQTLAGGRLQIDGEVHTPPQVLAKVNVHRRKADLPELTLADLRIG